MKPIIKMRVSPQKSEEIKYELLKCLKKYEKEDWIIIEITIDSNPPIEISAHGNMRTGFQGSIVIKLRRNHRKEELIAELKRGRACFYLGDVLKKNDVPTFLMYLEIIVQMWRWFIKPIINVIPTEYYMRKEWGLEVCLLDSQYRRPEWLGDAQKISVELEF